MNDIGDVPRENRNTGYKPQHALKYEDIHDAITFIVNYAAAVGMPQSEATRGRDGVPSIFLPSSDTKKGIHELYLASCDETNIRARKMSSFEEAWLKFVPYIKLSKPRDDVCHRCECLRKQVIDAVTEEEKLTVTVMLHRHLEDTRRGRSHYRTCIENSVKEMPNLEG